MKVFEKHFVWTVREILSGIIVETDDNSGLAKNVWRVRIGGKLI